MKTLLAAVAAALLTALLVQEKPAQEVTLLKAADVKWTPLEKAPPGVTGYVVQGTLEKGPSLLLMKIPAGATFRPHWHSVDEGAVVVSGTLLFGAGDRIDEAKGTELTSGSAITIPAKKPHWVIARSEVLVARFISGPMDVVFID